MAKSAMRMRFDRAFKEARDAGEKTFEFEGKSYNTKMKSTPMPPKRDVPRMDDFPSTPDAPARPTPAPSAPAESSVVTDPQTGIVPRRYGTVRSGFYRAGEDEVQGPEKPPTTGRLRAVGAKMAEENAGYPINPSDETGYRKGGMVKKKSGGMMKKKSGGMVKMKSGGAVRGAGIAQRGQGKMRIC